MKKTAIPIYALLIVSVISLCLSSCEKVKDALKVNVAMQTADISFTIPAQPAGTHTLSEFSTVLNVDSLIKAKSSSFGIDNIKSVKVISCVFTLLNGEGDDQFGALSDCKMEFSAVNNPTPVTLAEIKGNPDTPATTLNLPVNDIELRDYFTSSTFYYQLSGTTRRATSKALECVATVKFDVEVGL